MHHRDTSVFSPHELPIPIKYKCRFSNISSNPFVSLSFPPSRIAVSTQASRIPLAAVEKEVVSTSTEIGAEQVSSQAVTVDGFNNIIGTDGVASNQPNERYK